MSGRALSHCKLQLRKAVQTCRQRRYDHSQQLAQTSRSHATLEAHAETSHPGPSGGSDAASTFLSGLHFEAKKGFQNLQGKERFADFAARHTRHLLSSKDSEPLSDIAEAFEKYNVLSVRDRKAVVDKAIQEVHALAAGSSAQSRGERASSLPTDDASLGAVELPTSHGQPVGKVSSLKNLVGDRSKPVLLAADLEGMQSSADTLSHSTGAPAEQQRVAQVSQRNRGIKLMTAAGSSSAARLSSVADLAAASAEPRHEHSPAAKQPRVHAGGSQRAAVHQSHMRTQHLGAPTLSRAPSTAEQAYSMGAPAVLVGEDEEFSVGSDTHETPAELASTDALGSRRRVIKPETAAFRASFTQAAATAASTSLVRSSREGGELGQGEQRTAEWHAERQHRLTASAFGNALGFWPEGRVSLWEEKLQLKAPFRGNAATQWGTVQEDVALRCYTEVTGHIIKPCRFAVLRDDEVHGWLGASPDGLIDSLSAQPASPDDQDASMGPGVLEIKCPFNRGRPESASVPSLPPWYYMPQVQGLMEIFQREWCNIYLWTINGSAMFHIPRDRQYWTACFEVLSEYWWAHLVPAKHAIANNRRADAYNYMPSPSHKLTAGLTTWSKAMAKAAPASIYPPSQHVLR